MNDKELYLILHKVRGEPAFDVAQRMMIGDEEGWIIPTSGHRAYPIRWQLIDEDIEWTAESDMWKDLPDHYSAKRDDGHHLIDAAREILMRKGLISAAKPTQPLYRRF